MKNLIKVFLALAFIWNNPVSALGLGKETLHSTIGQKLFIEMPISGIDAIDQDQVRFSVAPVDVYELMNIDYNPDHHQYNLSIMPNDNGGLTLVVTSKKSIREPFIDFVINMSAPIGQLYKEVSVLLDTPANIAETYMEEPELEPRTASTQ